jgi:mono/diheme cytochrome c family protein
MWALGFAASPSAQPGPTDRPRVDPAAADRGRSVYLQRCVNCHGNAAKGTDSGPDLLRSVVVLRDRLGGAIGPALGSPAHAMTLTAAQVADVSHFLRQRIEAIAGNRNAPSPPDVLTGDPEAGRAFFNGAGGCSGCHSPAGDLAGLARRIPVPVNLQQRMLFPTLRTRQVEVTVTPRSGPAVSGTLVRIDDFTVALRDAAGEYRGFTRTPDLRVEVRDPLAAHYALLDRYTDADMHDVVAYLVTLK